MKGFNECPFCASDRIKLEVTQGRRGLFCYAKCERCHAQGPTLTVSRDDVLPNAANLWNLRLLYNDFGNEEDDNG